MIKMLKSIAQKKKKKFFVLRNLTKERLCDPLRCTSSILNALSAPGEAGPVRLQLRCILMPLIFPLISGDLEDNPLFVAL